MISLLLGHYNPQTMPQTIHTLSHNTEQISMQANNSYTFIQALYKTIHITSLKPRVIIITDLHILTKAHQIQLYKLLNSTIHEQFILISNCMPIAQIARICKIYNLETNNTSTHTREHSIIQYLRKNTLHNKDSMHDMIMQMDDIEAHTAMQAIGHFFEKCLLLRPQAYIALDNILLYWHQVYSDYASGLITSIQCIKLFWIYLGKHFFAQI